jgi:predicted  nucleic acid-binding Zn-ribbon protein
VSPHAGECTSLEEDIARVQGSQAALQAEFDSQAAELEATNNKLAAAEAAQAELQGAS